MAHNAADMDTDGMSFENVVANGILAIFRKKALNGNRDNQYVKGRNVILDSGDLQEIKLFLK